MSSQPFPIPGSAVNFQATLISKPNFTQKITVEIILRKKTLAAKVQEELGLKIYLPPHKREYLNHKELEQYFGPAEEDIKTMTDYFAKFNIKVVKKRLIERVLVLSGTIKDFQTAFSTHFGVFQGTGNAVFLSYKDSLNLPQELVPIVKHVNGLTEPLKVEYRLPTQPSEAEGLQDFRKGYPAPQVAKAYNYPSGVTGKGQCIAFVELGGTAKASDFKAYFKDLGIKAPEIITVGQPLPSKNNLLNNTEVTLDLQVAGAMAPGAKLVIYYANTILEAMKMIVNDKKNKPTVVSISWAGPESNYTPAQVAELNSVFYEAALLGMTVLAASGDHGAFFSSRTPNVAIPSSNPLVLGVGGTILKLNDETISSEVVWNELQGQVASGGGFSSLYPQAYYQKGAIAAYPYQKGATRGVPDLAANASTVDGYQLIFDGKPEEIGGTSAATPVVAALIALLNEALGYNLGFVNAMFYEFGARGFRQINSGNNNYYQAALGWNPCTGLGSPNGEALLELFKAYEKAD